MSSVYRLILVLMQDLVASLINTITGHVPALALQVHGCRVIQKAIEVLPTEQQCLIACELHAHTVRCSKHRNGNHVVQGLIQHIQPSSKIAFIYEVTLHRLDCRSTNP